MLTIDAESNLLARWDMVDSHGAQHLVVDRIEYDVDIADSTFVAAIPRGMIVIDGLTPAKPAVTAARKAEVARLVAAGGRLRCNSMGAGASWGDVLMALTNDYFAVVYIPERKAYHVVGKALLIGHGRNRLVENTEIPAAVAGVEQAPAPRASRFPERDAEVERLQLSGEGAVICSGAGPGASCSGGANYPKLAFGFMADDSTVIYMRKTNTFRIFGKARVYGMGIDKVVENGDFPAPGPPDKPAR